MMTAAATTSNGMTTRARRGLAALLVVHGIAHLVGVAEIVGADDTEPVTYALDRWELTSGPALAMFGVLWGLLAVAFVVVGIATCFDAARWTDALPAVTQLSIVACTIALPEAAIGLGVNAGLLVLDRRRRDGSGGSTP